MAKLWQKGYELNEVVEAFTVGEDPALDRALVKWDAVGSMAHARMLAAIGVLTAEEAERLRAELAAVVALDAGGKFEIRREHEDVHTAIEDHLVKTLGDVGKKLHTARSRNDQVILDMRLYMRERYAALAGDTLALIETLIDLAEKYKDVPIPGRTHFQRAMPSSVGLWAGAFAESLLDDLLFFEPVVAIVDQCPLGSAAGYGVNLPIDRQMVSDLLGFAKVQNNVLYVNNSRGKVESMFLSACVQAVNDLGKLAADVIVWCVPEFGYFTLPEEFCPGSSLMPQKRNPCPFELVRASASIVQADLAAVLGVVKSLASGYHRDFQLTKGPFMSGVETTLGCLRVSRVCMERLKVNAEACIRAFTPDVFATDRVLDLVKQGVPFRDAYRKVAASLGETAMEDPIANIRAKTHLGATGNLGLDLARGRAAGERRKLSQRDVWEKAIERLVAG